MVFEYDIEILLVLSYPYIFYYFYYSNIFSRLNGMNPTKLKTSLIKLNYYIKFIIKMYNFT